MTEPTSPIPPAHVAAYMSALRQDLRTRIVRSGLSRLELATLLGVSTGTLRRKLAGDSTLSIRDIGNFAHALGIKPLELMAAGASEGN